MPFARRPLFDFPVAGLQVFDNGSGDVLFVISE
jgi:hypothetical protein